MAVQKTHLKTKGVGIKDLDDFRRDLQRIVREGGPDGISLLKAANHKVAEHIREKAVTRAAGVGKQSHRAAQTLRASRIASTARITLGKASVPYAEGAEFGTELKLRDNIGGRNGPNPGIGWLQFRKQSGELLESRPDNRTGHFLFPTMRAESARIKQMYLDELDEICRIAFPNGRL